MREGFRLTKKFIGSIVEIHCGKNRAFDLEHDFLPSECPVPVRSASISIIMQ